MVWISSITVPNLVGLGLEMVLILLFSQLLVLYNFLFTKYIMIVVGATSGLVLPTTRCADSHARVHSDSQVCQSKHSGNTCFVVCLL